MRYSTTIRKILRLRSGGQQLFNIKVLHKSTWLFLPIWDNKKGPVPRPFWFSSIYEVFSTEW